MWVWASLVASQTAWKDRHYHDIAFTEGYAGWKHPEQHLRRCDDFAPHVVKLGPYSNEAAMRWL